MHSNILGILGFINTFDLKVVSRIQVAFTVSKISALLIIICAGAYTAFSVGVSSGDTVEEWFPTSKNPFDFSKVMMALYGGLYTYSGWFVRKKMF